MVDPATPRLRMAEGLLQRHYGYPRFRPDQRRAILSILAGDDLLAVLPTGAGKSVCFQVPALLGPGLTLVVSPLISLMQDQVAAARRRGLPARYLNSSLPAEGRQAVLEEVAKGECRLLYVAPERLERLGPELAGTGITVSLLAVDEAHCISEWGHDFRLSYRAIGPVRIGLGWPQTVALTGSATPDVRRDIVASLGLGAAPSGRNRRDLVASFDRPNLRFEVFAVRDDRERLRQLVRLLEEGRETSIVYAPTRNLTESLARLLLHRGIAAIPYHAGLTADWRQRALDDFLASRARVVVATCAFGMGIDKPNVRLVAHWALPPTPESYYQEAGRAGRDGADSRCVLLYRRSDPEFHRMQLSVTYPDEQVVERAWRDPAVLGRLPSQVRASIERLREELRPDTGPVDWRRVRDRRRLARRRLDVMVRYAAEGSCRRRILLGWFGETLSRCSGCDRCRTITPRWWLTAAAPAG